MKFLKNCTFFRSRNAKSGIVDIDAQPTAVAPAADKHAALWSVFDCVGDEILQQSPQETPVGLDRERAGCELEFYSFVLCQRREHHLQLEKQLVNTKSDDFWLHCPGIEAGNVEQCPEY